MVDDSSVSGWIKQLVAGNTGEPVEKLWQRYFEKLVDLARLNLGRAARRAADEEDVALSAFGSFCAGAVEGKFPLLTDRDSLWRLLITITARKAYQLRLSDGRQKRGGNAVLDQAALAAPGGNGAGAMELDQFLSSEPTPEFAMLAREAYADLFRRLPDDQLRQVAQWKMEGYTNAEIAAKLGCAPRTVERRLLLIRALWLEE